LTNSNAMAAALNAANDVSCKLKARPNQLSMVNNRSLVKAVLLIDDRKKDSASAQTPIQALVPATHLIELELVNQALGGDFRGLSDAEAMDMFELGLDDIPALPNWNGLECLIHDSLLNQHTILLDAGASEDLIELDQNSFTTLVGACCIQEIAHPVPPRSSSPENDEKAILDSVQRFTERRIRQRLDETLELPPLPRTAARVLKLRSQEDADVDELVSIVESDPSLAAQVVGWASSPYYRAPGEVRSVHDAIVRVLGFDMVLNLALGLSLGKSITLTKISISELNTFWRNSVLLASTCESLALGMPKERRPHRGAVYLAGLLANLGHLILAEVFPLYFQQIQRHAAANRHLSSPVIERHVLGIDNNQIASWLLENWEMPKEFVESVRHANEWSYNGDHNASCKLILCARHILAREKLAAHAGPNFAGDMLDLLNVDEQFAERQIQQIVEASQEFDQKIG